MSVMPVEKMPNHAAIAERAAPADLKRQTALFASDTLAGRLLDAVPDIIIILNQHLQIVYANRALMTLVGVQEREALYGLRPGEALDCVHARASSGGCNTSEACSTCGGALSALAGFAGCTDVQECRVTRCVRGRLEAMDLRVSSTPLREGSEDFAIFTASDISHEKRRRTLESLFFHDILNVVGSIKGFAELQLDHGAMDNREATSLIHAAAERVIEEIQAQRTLAEAESRELRVRPKRVDVGTYLNQLVELYRRHEAADGKDVVLEPVPAGTTITSDPTLLGRVLGNMLKNALEASRAGQRVTVRCCCAGDRIEFSVHNPAVIPGEAQLQVFQRSFSTKGLGRGLGTYSMRLLSEYLQGEVAFSSCPGEGTIFRASYPLRLV